jgi:hypothetical protein
MLVQIWNWENQVWLSVDTISNEDGSFDWMAEHLDISSYAMGQVFKIRFAAVGEDSINILAWYIDNIHVYRGCNPPLNLNAYYSWDGIDLDWESPAVLVDKWIHWADWDNSGNSIGGADEYDVAARWEPWQLGELEGGKLTKVAIFPVEELDTYHIKVWEGTGAELLIVNQAVVNPVIDQ